MLMADNVWWDGRLGKGLQIAMHGNTRFSATCGAGAGLERLVLPLRDGLMLIRKK
jgi:hypothetical protein